MMMGPEPMMRMRWRSVRLGMRVVGHQGDEVVEKIPRIVRAGSGFGMILYAEHRMIAHAETLQRLIVQVDVRNFHLSQIQSVGIDGEAVVVRGDLDFIGELVE